jgi:hypothetical protein
MFRPAVPTRGASEQKQQAAVSTIAHSAQERGWISLSPVRGSREIAAARQTARPVDVTSRPMARTARTQNLSTSRQAFARTMNTRTGVSSVETYIHDVHRSDDRASQRIAASPEDRSLLSSEGERAVPASATWATSITASFVKELMESHYGDKAKGALEQDGFAAVGVWPE